MGKGALCDYLGDASGLPRHCSVKGLPWNCQGIAERFPSKRLAILEGLPLLLTADGLPVDCLGKQGCRLGIVQGYPWGFFNRLLRGNE